MNFVPNRISQTKLKSGRVSRNWSPSDIDKLRLWADKRLASDIAKSLRRSKGATTAKAFELRLSLQLPKGERPTRLPIRRDSPLA
jgi:hypothetical protein